MADREGGPRHMAPPMETNVQEDPALELARAFAWQQDSATGVLARALIAREEETPVIGGGSLQATLPVLMEAQAELQRGSFQDIYSLDPEQRMEFVRWNVLALEDELHEMLSECGWKPWATSRHINQTGALKELVDALHFFMNLVIAIGGYDEAGLPVSPRELGEILASLYFEKRAVNAKRQAEGYTGLDKCPDCKRDASFLVTNYLGTTCMGCGHRVVKTEEVEA